MTFLKSFLSEHKPSISTNINYYNYNRMTSTTTSATVSSVKVNVKLCGSVPRDEIEGLTLVNCAPLVLQSSSSQQNASRSCLNRTSSYLSNTTNNQDPTTNSVEDGDRVAAELCSQLCSFQQQPSQPIITDRRVSPTYEAPGWAVPACGEARLEPIFDSINRQPPIDLTKRSVFRIGRSPQSDVQLLHATSSRKHAMLFHHKNGSCYIIDCNSAHGTFLNGVRITSLPNGGVVVPQKIRRGSIVRFGGPGAPSFMLKSFSFGLEEMREYPIASNKPLLSPSSASIAEVQHNTRFNALGATAKNSLIVSLSSKRSFDSMSTVEDAEYDCKQPRCTSPPLSPQQVPVRLVSPDFNHPGKRRRVSFSSAPPKAFYPNLVSPDLSSDENDCEDSV